ASRRGNRTHQRKNDRVGVSTRNEAALQRLAIDCLVVEIAGSQKRESNLQNCVRAVHRSCRVRTKSWWAGCIRRKGFSRPLTRERAVRTLSDAHLNVRQWTNRIARSPAPTDIQRRGLGKWRAAALSEGDHK